MLDQSKPLDVSSLDIEGEVSALLKGGDRSNAAPSIRRSIPRIDRRLPEPRIEDSAEVAQSAGASDAEEDRVNHPKHYTSHPSGIECIEVTRWMNFNLGNVVKYVWRSAEKGATIEDLEKARWYLDDEIKRLKGLVT